VSRGLGVVLHYLSEFYPEHQLAVLASGPTFAERPEVARRFAVAFLRAIRDWNDASQHGVGVEPMAHLLAANNGLSVELNADLLRRRALAQMHPDGRINKESIVYDSNWYVRNGLLDRVPDVDRFVDAQYAAHAAAQLGPYSPPRQP
jgi:NitT/TauT family transport system substrate-binding protein